MAAGRLTEDQLEGLRLELISRLTIKRAHDGATQTYCCRYVSPACAEGWHFPLNTVVHTSMFTREGKKKKKNATFNLAACDGVRAKARILSFWV